MPAPSLLTLARRCAQKQLRYIDDFGELPWEIIRPILLHIDNADQLRRIEENSPHLEGETGEIWLKLIQRDILNWEKKPHTPRNPKSWHKVYRKLKQEAEEERKAAEDKLAESFRALSEGKKEARIEQRLTVGNHVERGRKQKSTLAKLFNKSSLAFGAGTRTKNAMTMARGREGEMRAARHGALSTPSHMLADRASRVMSVPKSMQRAQVKPEFEPAPRIAAPRRPSITQGSTAAKLGPQAMEDREKRLRALKERGAASASPIPAPVRAAASTTTTAPRPERLPPSVAPSQPMRRPPPIRRPSPPTERAAAGQKRKNVDVFLPGAKRVRN